VAQLFGLPDVALLDLRTRLAGGAVATAKATSSSGQTAAISGEQLRVGLSLPSAYIARAVEPEPTTATALSASLSRRGGSPVVVQASNTTVVALAAGFAGATKRPLFVVGSQGPKAKAKRALRPAKSVTAVGAVSPAGLRSLSKLAKVRRVTAPNAVKLSLKLARLNPSTARRAVFAATPANPSAMATAAMGATRARGTVIAVNATPSAKTVKWVAKRAKRTIIVAGKKEISNAAAAALRKPVRLGTQNPVIRSARIASLGSRHGEAILVDTRRPMAAAAAAATGRPVLFVAPAGNAKAVRFLQASPAIATLRTVGADSAVVAAARRA
jgi:CO dehydrogenase/acetyl-CoA synthase epsilon subunit